MTYPELTQLANQYADSKVLLTANTLGVSTALGQTKQTVQQVAKKCRATQEGMELLLNALVGLKILRRQNGKYWNTHLAKTYLDAKSPKAITNLLWLLEHHWSNWTEMTLAIRKGRPGWSPVTHTPDFQRRFALAMHERSLVLAPLTIASCRLPRGATRFFDLAGGSGSYSMALAKKFPRLTGTIIDQSVVVARQLIKQQGLEGRLAVQKGDIFSAPLPGNSDAALAANIFHDFNISENRRLLRRIRKALRPGGKIFIVEFFLDDSKTQPVDAAVFSLLMYGFTNTGRSYSWKEVEGWLSAEGFGQIHRHVVKGSIGTLEAVRL